MLKIIKKKFTFFRKKMEFCFLAFLKYPASFESHISVEAAMYFNFSLKE